MLMILIYRANVYYYKEKHKTLLVASKEIGLEVKV
jgi:hypothetical protein